jgi:HTH-type transcriptional regulator, competence development regulator
MAAEQNWEKLGSYLRELRRHKRLSLRQVQEETGASGSYLSQVEQDRRHPSARLLRKLAPTYGASVRDLLTIAGYLNEPEVNMSDQERIEWAFKCLVSDPAYQYGRSLAASSGLSLEAKSSIVEVYEKLTGRKLR